MVFKTLMQVAQIVAILCAVVFLISWTTKSIITTWKKNNKKSSGKKGGKDD